MSSVRSLEDGFRGGNFGGGVGGRSGGGFVVGEVAVTGDGVGEVAVGLGVVGGVVSVFPGVFVSGVPVAVGEVAGVEVAVALGEPDGFELDEESGVEVASFLPPQPVSRTGITRRAHNTCEWVARKERARKRAEKSRRTHDISPAPAETGTIFSLGLDLLATVYPNARSGTLGND